MTSLLQNEQGNSVTQSKVDLPKSEFNKSNIETDDSLRANVQKRDKKLDKKLENAQRKYEYNYTYIPSIAMVDMLSGNEYPSKAWVNLLAEQITIVVINELMNSKNKILQIFRNDILKNFLAFIVQVIARWVIYPLLKIIGFLKSHKVLHQILRILLLRWIIKFSFAELILKLLFSDNKPDNKNHTEDVNSLQQYNNLFKEIKLPKIAHNFQEDEMFAYMRVAGYNPVMIERVKTANSLNSLINKFPVTEAQYQEVMGVDDSLVEAVEDGRLYLADYQILQGSANGTFPKEQKYLYAPLALFAVPKGSDSSRLMRPVAIQCSQNPEDQPIVTPKSDKYAWLFAKTIVQIADANFHEAVSHLGRTHLFVGRFAIATHRQLPDNHPLSLLLRPHFQGTLAINDAAQEFLVSPGGGVDELLSATIDNSRTLVEADLQNYSFNQAMLPKQLEKRGVDDTDKLPVYPYRDDALQIWKAIQNWVSDYLSIYYKNDQAVQSDTYLQQWAKEAKAYDGARVHDFGEQDGDTPILTLNYLIDAVTLIIFTASAQHAAVNFPQKDIMSYMPAVPLAGYQPTSILKGKVSEQDYLKLLPPLKQAGGQLNLLYLLGSVYYTKLGYYEDNYFQHPSVETALKKFQKNLQEIETKITLRNQICYTYEYLLPSRIPQSINI